MTGTLHIVEADDAVRASLMALLSLRDDITLHGYRSAEQFLEQLDARAPGVLLVDYRMPGMTGPDLLSVLRRHETRFVPIVLTGEGDVALAVSAMKAGAVDILEKPCDRDRLLQSVDAAFAQLDRHRADRVPVDTARLLIERLSPRERSVLAGLIRGGSNKVIAHELDLSPRTVEIHRANLMDKLGVRNLPDALRIVFTAGLADAL